MIAPLADSALALRTLSRTPGLTETIAEAELDSLLFVSTGSGVLSVGESSSPLRTGSAALVLAGEEATIESTDELGLVVLTAGASTDLHAPMGKRELVVSLDGRGAAAGDGRTLVPAPLRAAQRLDTRDALRRLRPARQGAVALPPVRRDRLRARRAGPPAPRRRRPRSSAQARPSGFGRGRCTSSRTWATRR